MNNRKESAEKSIIALLTDFGSKDWFVASMKGVIKGIAPHVDIVDITHHIDPHHVESASFILASCYRDFPEGTVFCCVVDPGVGTSRKRLASFDGARYFIAPDNGLLTYVALRSEALSCRFIENPAFRNQGHGATFEGRDVFAPAAAYLASGVDMEKFGPPCRDMARLDLFENAGVKNGVLEGRIVYVDHFGNLITNLTPRDLEKDWDECRAVIDIKGGKIHGVSKGYGDVESGALLAYWGSTGCLEIAVNQGSAAGTLGIRIGENFFITCG
ncbi:SAM-dependent chlorinase/fluorinase [Candidatus Sumerlaeota bacterium]|nr:SAM-dependent chlorinase/fluorinase [Candidatus Sumerlaeota bacterium]